MAGLAVKNVLFSEEVAGSGTIETSHTPNPEAISNLWRQRPVREPGRVHLVPLVLFSGGGIALAGLLLVLGLVMTSNANFALGYVRDQLSQQNITFKPAAALTDEGRRSRAARAARRRAFQRQGRRQRTGRGLTATR